MKAYKVILDRNACIGAASCVEAHDTRFSLADDGKSRMKDGAQDGKHHVLIVDEAELEQMRKAAKSCPMRAIRIEDIT